MLWPYALGPSWSPAIAAWYFVVDLVWVAAMVATYLRDPAGPMWKLFLAYRIVDDAGVLWVLPTSLTWTLSQLVTGLGSVVFVHLVLAFPTGRLVDRTTAASFSGAYVFLAVTRLAWVLVWQPTPGQVGFAPRNPFVIAPNEQLAWLFGPVALVVLGRVLLVTVVFGLARHWRRASPALRRSLLPITIAAPIQLGAHRGGTSPARSRPSGVRSGRRSSRRSSALAGLVFPIGYLLGLLQARLARAGVADLAVELGRGVPLGGLRDSLARRSAIRPSSSPSRRPSGDGFVGPDGQPIELPGAADPAGGRAPRARRRAPRGPRLRPGDRARGSGRVAAVGSVARLALENERLAAQVRAQLEEVRAVAGPDRRGGGRGAAPDRARPARRRPAASRRPGDAARSGRATSAGASELIDATTVELLARSARSATSPRRRPSADPHRRGPRRAVEALAERTPSLVAIDATDARFAPEVEAAAYFVVAEGLTNIARYAEASRATVVLRTEEDRLVVRVSDNGRGGADPEAGSGLRGSRIGWPAIGGELTVRANRARDDAPGLAPGGGVGEGRPGRRSALVAGGLVVGVGGIPRAGGPRGAGLRRLGRAGLGGVQLALGLAPRREDRLHRAGRFLDRRAGRGRRAGLGELVDQLGLRPLARARGEDALRDQLDPGGEVDEPWVARLDRPLLVLELLERLEVAKQRVGGAAEGVPRPWHRVPPVLPRPTKWRPQDTPRSSIHTRMPGGPPPSGTRD